MTSCVDCSGWKRRVYFTKLGAPPIGDTFECGVYYTCEIKHFSESDPCPAYNPKGGINSHGDEGK